MSQQIIPRLAPRMQEVGVPDRQRPQPTVLVVEDNGMVRTLTARALRESGYRVLEAADGLAALEALAGAEKITLVVTDIVMPRMDGYELVARLMATPKPPAVLFMSGYGMAHRELPAPLLEKPFSPAVLQAKVQRLLDMRAQP